MECFNIDCGRGTYIASIVSGLWLFRKNVSLEWVCTKAPGFRYGNISTGFLLILVEKSSGYSLTGQSDSSSLYYLFIQVLE